MTTERICASCQAPILDNDAAGVCTICGGLNIRKRLPRGERRPEKYDGDGELAGVLMCGLAGMIVGIIGTLLLLWSAGVLG